MKQTKQNKTNQNLHKSNPKQTTNQLCMGIMNLFKPDRFWEVFKQVCWQGHCTQMEIVVKQNSVAAHLLDLVRRDFKGHF